MDNPNPIKYSDLIVPDATLDKLIEKLGLVISKYGELRSKIQTEAQGVVQSMKNVTSATEEQRKQIEIVTQQSDKLVATYKQTTDAERVARQELEATKQARKEQNEIDKLIVKINRSVEGSYDRLSAQYNLNKIRLNKLSAEQRATIPEFQQLEKETAQMYEEMKRLQEVTGKHTLNVGNYGDATKNLRGELMQLINEMASLKAEGKDNTEQYEQMRQRAGKLRDAMADTREEIGATASDTQQLSGIMKGLAVGGGLFTLTKQMGLFSSANQDAQESEKALQKAMAVVTALIMIQNALQKQSALMVGISTIKTWALAKAEQMRAKWTTASTLATQRATISQKAFNVVAKANPYVLLAVLLASVVGGIIAFAIGTNRAVKEQKKMNELIKIATEYKKQLLEINTRLNKENIAQLQRDLEVAKSQNKSLKEQRKIEDDIYHERVDAHNKRMIQFGEEISGYDKNLEKLGKYQKMLKELKDAQAKGFKKLAIDIDLNGNVERWNIEKAIEVVQGKVDNTKEAVEIAVEFKTEGAEITKERAVQLAQRIQEQKDIAKAEQQILRDTYDKRNELIHNAYVREGNTIRENAKRQIEDIRKRLSEEVNLTTTSRQALQKQILLIEASAKRQLLELDNKQALARITARRETEDMELALLEEGQEKQERILYQSYERQTEDIKRRLATDMTLTTTQRKEMNQQLLLIDEKYAQDYKRLQDDNAIATMKRDKDTLAMRLESVRKGSRAEQDLTIEMLAKERDIEIAENERKTKDVQQRREDIEAKWNAKIIRTAMQMSIERAERELQANSDLAQSEIDAMEGTEREKTRRRLEAERQRLQGILDINAKYNGELTQQQIATIKNQIKAIDREVKSARFTDLGSLLAEKLFPNAKEGSLGATIKANMDVINDTINTTMDNIGQLIDAWVQEADAEVELANKRVESAKASLDAEIEARANGYANNVEEKQKELELQKEQQRKANEERKKAQKVQLALDTIQQTSSLITASANIWSSFGYFPPLAIAMLSLMWGSFAGAKIKAIQMASKSEEYGEGTIELLEGGSHASGHDIDLGRKKDGTRRRAEGGEYFAVINKRNSKRFGALIPDVIKSFNNGTFADKYQRIGDVMTQTMYSIATNGETSPTDVTALERGVDAIRQQGERRQYLDAQGNIVEQYKNVRRTIRRS